MKLFAITVEDNELRVMMNTAELKLTPEQQLQMGQAIRDSGARVQARAIRNVSGYPVQADGMTFRINVRTGALKGAIQLQYPYQSTLQARVYVDGTHTSPPTIIGGMAVKAVPVSRYASSIEYGHDAIDLKKTMLGKTVPFFASKSQSSVGPYTGRGLRQDGSGWVDDGLNHRLAERGAKGPMTFKRHRAPRDSGGSYYIAFRKVGKTGWVIPAAKPRPFMRAALSQSTSDTRQIVGAQLQEVMRHDGPNQ